MAKEGDQRDHPTRGTPQIFKGGKWVNKRSSKSSAKGNRDSEFIQSKKVNTTDKRIKVQVNTKRGRKFRVINNPNYKPPTTDSKGSNNKGSDSKGSDKTKKHSTKAVWNLQTGWTVPANVEANKAHKAQQEADRLKINNPKRKLNLKEVSKYSGKGDKKDSYQTMKELYSKSDSETSDTQQSGSNVTTPKKKDERQEWLDKTRNSPAAKAGFSDKDRWDLQKKHRQWQADREKAGKLKGKRKFTNQLRETRRRRDEEEKNRRKRTGGED